MFGLSIIGCITTTTLLLLPESNILDNLSLKVKKVLTLTGDVKTIFKLQNVNLSLNNIWILFRSLFRFENMDTSPVRVKTFFAFKDKLPKMLLLGLVYKFKWGGCNATYYGKTKHHFKVRICEYLGISHLPEKKLKIDNNKLMAIQKHFLCCNYSPPFEDFCSVLTRESNDFKLRIMECLLVARDKPILNKADSSLPLELF